MLAAVAAQVYPTLTDAMSNMSQIARVYPPKQDRVREFHRMKAASYAVLQEADRKSRLQ
jgi:ribulose kinase